MKRVFAGRDRQLIQGCRITGPLDLVTRCYSSGKVSIIRPCTDDGYYHLAPKEQVIGILCFLKIIVRLTKKSLQNFVSR